jgi:hypothetical protein
MRTFRRETLLYAAALLLALGVRLISLGILPLNDGEALWALQALNIANGIKPAIGSQPAYVLLTSLLFFAYGGATNFLARLIPALVGSSLVLVPALFKRQLKPRPALILAFAIALEPGLAAASRQIGTSIMALTFLLAAWGLWERGAVRWAGVAAALAILSGPGLWPGLLGLGLTWAIWQPFERGSPTPDNQQPPPRTRGDWLAAVLYGAATLVVMGTLFFLAPGGISAWLQGLPEYLRGWVQLSGISGGLVLFSLVAYQPLGLILALIAIVRGWIRGNRRIRRLSLWLVISLLLVLFHPGRQITDLVWVVVPLWALASLELARNLNVHPKERAEVLGAATLTVLILAFVWLDFLGLDRLGIPPDLAATRTWLMFGSLLLLVLCLLLIAVGWSVRIARFGVVWGIVGALGMYTLAAAMGAAGLRSNPGGVDMWRQGADIPQSDLLLSSIRDMSQWSDKEANAQPVTLVGIDSPAMLWLLRDRAVTTQAAVGPAERAPMLVTADQDNPVLDAGYRGQSLVWRHTPLWNQTTPDDWMRWLAFHQLAGTSDSIILWVRSDLFLDARPAP